MTTLDDWPRVKRVLAEALEREGGERRSYLDEACGSDAQLRARVETLLAAGEQAGTFLEAPTGVLLEPEVLEDLSGLVVGSYRLTSRLGAGGTGQVYLAHDSKLDRPVALKLLSPALAGDRDRVRRFQQEARAASSLNHPHIVVVHDSGDLDGRPYIVTELIEGETLRHRLRQGPLPIRDAVEIGVHVAGALAAAHARGLVHRDVKPENIMVRPDGYAKVLDFGLAKLAAVSRSSADGDESRTQTGMVIGTPRYMSPEQARGLELDARADVWSLGVVMYEMATGGLPFAEDGSVMALDSDRNVPTASERAPHDLPPELLRIICKALHTVRDLRYPSAAELCADLKQLQREVGSPRSSEADAGGPRQPASLGPGRLGVAAALVVALGALVTVPWIRGHRELVPAGVQKSVAVLPFDNLAADGSIDYLRLALADEVATVLSGTPSLAVRPLASSRKFAASAASPQEAGRELHAGSVVTGHFSMHQSELRVTVEAVEVDTNRLLWRDTIAARAADPIALRDRLISRIRDGLLPALGTTATAAARARPRNAEAYALYLKSLALSTDPGPTREAIPLLERASSLDPDHADTWNALSSRYYANGYYSAGGIEEMRRSEAAARHALALDPGHSGAALRLVLLHVEAGGRLQDAYDSAKRLVAQRPDSGEAHFALSYVFRYGGLLEDFARECEEAASRDPTNPRFRGASAGFMLLGRYDRALDFIRLDSGSEAARVLRRLVYQRMGRRHDAREEHRQQSPDYPSGLVPASFHGFIARCLSGDAPDGQARLREEDVRTFLTRQSDPEPLYFFGSDLAYCGDTAAAVQLLRESIRRNYCAAVAIETDPMFAAVRKSPEYADLLREAHACRTRFSEHVRRSRSDG